MDETQHFCLRWNNYQSSITSAFENLRDDEDFVDVTLACEGRSIKAHRVVLSACSPYFRDLLKSTPCKHPVILLQDVNFLDLHSLVEFIYHGEVNVHQKSLQSFLKTAEVLRVSGLTQQQAEETHSQLAQIHNLANTAAAAAAAIGRTSINSHHTSVHDDGPLYPRMQTGSPPPQQLPLASQHINSQLFKRSYQAAAMIRRNSSTPSGEDVGNPMKRIRSTSATGIPSMGDNGLPSTNNNSPDMLHQQSNSPQLTPADFSSTMKSNNNHTPSFKEEKRNGPTGNGNGLTSGSEKLGSLTPSPLARSADDVKSEPMELVCSNNNQNSGACDEHSNDSTGENDANRSSSADGGKGSLSSGNDEEIENSLPSHPPPPFLTMSPADPKLFASAGFTFPMPIDSSALVAGFGSQLSTPADLGASPQGGSTSSLLGGVLVPGGGNSANSHDSHSNNNSNNNSNNSNNDNNNLHQHHIHTMHLKHEQNQHTNEYTHQQHLHQQQQQQQQQHEEEEEQQHQNDERETPTKRPTPFDDDDKPGNITPASTTRSTPNHQHQQLLSDKDRERERERDEDVKRLVVIPSPSHHQMRSLTPIPTSAHHQQQSAYGNALQRQHHQQTGLPLSMMASHHLHPTALHSPSANAHHHHHLARTASPLEHHTHPHHHLLHPRRSSLSPSPTGGRSSMLNSRADVGNSASSRLLLPLPLNACHRCDVCGKLLSTKLTLKRHKEQQHLQPLNNAVCNLCHKVFRTLNSLNNHKSIYHRRQKTHHHHSYFHHANAGSGSSLGNAGSPSSRLHQSLSSLSNNGGSNGNAVAAAAVAAAAAAELLLSPIVGAAAGAGGQVSQAQLSAAAAAAAAHQQNSPNLVKPCMDFL